MSRKLNAPITDKTEWISPADFREIYGASRNTLLRILMDAREKGIGIRVAHPPFRSGAEGSRRRPFVRINKSDMDAYFNRFSA